ncbi:hypothetical protein RF11_01748 [Thelohanellus kitauei]|uniref:Uncharacterized protein n=1 Tax=Thelohanellus kitauei TaxID=669202 RepID=A0A0C2MHA2_THEKT|nr:hypothetical protein RF11_01748 [Thelohanellus kitauei]
METDSQSTTNDGNSLLSYLSDYKASEIDTESTSTSGTMKTAKTQRERQKDNDISIQSAEDYAREIIAKHAQDPSFGVDQDGVALSEEQMAAKINEMRERLADYETMRKSYMNTSDEPTEPDEEALSGDNEQEMLETLDEKNKMLRLEEEVLSVNITTIIYHIQLKYYKICRFLIQE